MKQAYEKAPVFMSVKATAKHTGLSTCYLYKLIRAGKIKTAKIGVKYMIHIESLIENVLSGKV